MPCIPTPSFTHRFRHAFTAASDRPAARFHPRRPVTYRFAPFEHVNIVTAENETDVKNFTAVTGQVSGTVTFYPAPQTDSAALTVNGASLSTGLLRDEYTRSADWFIFDKMPANTFTSSRSTFCARLHQSFAVQFSISVLPSKRPQTGIPLLVSP